MCVVWGETSTMFHLATKYKIICNA